MPIDPQHPRARRAAYRTPPPLTHGGGTPEGAEIVREVPGATGVVLAGALRDLMLWLELPEGQRKSAFPPWDEDAREPRLAIGEAEPELWSAILIVLDLRREAVAVDEVRLVHACRRIAGWAEAHGSPATRLAYLQAAALLRADQVALAVEVAQLARDAHEHPRAESWFRHAVRQARRQGDWTSYVWAYVGLGVLYIRTGNPAAGHTVMLRALTTARRRRLPALAGVAHHHLFHLATEAGRLRDAYEHARAALEAYGPANPRLPALVADVGRYWLALRRPERARPILESVLHLIADPNDRAVVTANATWAAASLGDREGYERHRRHTLHLVETAPHPRQLDEAHLSVACGDLEMEEWGRAVEAATAASRQAQRSGNAEVRLRAEGILTSAREHRAMDAAIGEEEGEGLARQAGRLAGRLLAAVSGER